MNELIERLRAFWAARDAAQRVRLVGAALAAVAVAGGLSWWASQVTYRPVLSGASYDDLLEAAGALDAAEIEHEITTDGRLLVPASLLGRARAAVASSTQVAGLGDVDELKLGLTPRAQEWALLRAREGDLARMVNGIEGVASSQVQIVPRQEAFFLDDERPARASVFVRLRPGADLGQGQVRAIRSLVASSVDGLDIEQVTVADDRGTLLARAEAAEGRSGGDPADLLAYRREMESELEGSVVQALLPVLGSPSFFSVTAGVELDLTSSETVSKQVKIQEQGVLSEQVQESQSARADAQGVPGVDANLPERGGAGAAEQTSQKSALVTNYIYPTVDEVRTRPAGGLERVNVAVQVDSARIAAMAAASEGQMDEQALKTAIEGAIRAAVGSDAERGDTVQVSYLPFTPVEWEAPAEASVMASFAVEGVLPWAVAGVAVVLAFLFVVRPMVAVATKPVPKPTPAEEAAIKKKADPTDSDLVERLVDLVENFEPMDTTMLNQLVENQSMAAAQVLRTWNRSA
jgi:flagellar M-ring protein FliF